MSVYRNRFIKKDYEQIIHKDTCFNFIFIVYFKQFLSAFNLYYASRVIKRTLHTPKLERAVSTCKILI